MVVAREGAGLEQPTALTSDFPSQQSLFAGASTSSVDNNKNNNATLEPHFASLLPPLKANLAKRNIFQESDTNISGVNNNNKMADNKKCFFELAVLNEDDEPIKTLRVEIQLFSDRLPKTCQNFAQLCEGTMDKYDEKMCYTNSVLHYIQPGWVLVGGDFVNNNGSGGKSIFGREFEDESFDSDYSKPGLLCMLNHGPNTNNSQFFITLKPAEWINNLYVAFGRVTSDLEVLKKLADEVGSNSGMPKKTVKISSSGRIH